MKNLIIILFTFLLFNSKIRAQCTNISNNQVDFAAVSIDPIKGSISIGEITTIESLFQNNVSGTSAYIPTNDARITISIPSNVTFETGSFVSSTGLFTITSISASTLQIRNTGGNWIIGDDEIISFNVKGAVVTDAGATNNIGVASSLGPNSNCGDINGANQSSKGTIIVNSAPLPLKLISFNGKQFGNENYLNWKTSDEENISYFELQRSSNFQEFTALGKITNTNQKTGYYNFIDKNPNLEFINYYRLKIFETDGNYSFSKIIKISINEKGENIFLENPTLNKELMVSTINIKTPLFILRNSIGKNENIEIEKISDNKYLIKTYNSVAGVYFLTVQTINGLITKKVIIQ